MRSLGFLRKFLTHWRRHGVRAAVAKTAQFVCDRTSQYDHAAPDPGAVLWATAYLVQDYETRFHPGSLEAGLADLTYDFGLLGLFNTPGLRDAVLADHAMLGHAFQPGIDHDVFYPDAKLPDMKRMFFYGRPDVPRNGFSLGVADDSRLQAA